MSPWPSVDRLLPHGPEARCVDSILEFAPGERLLAGLTIRPDLALYEEPRGGIPVWGGIEIMAQTSGLYVGLEDLSRGSGPPKLGYLLSVKHFQAACDVLPANAYLVVEAVCGVRELGGLARFDCRILCGGRESVRATLTVWRAPGERGG